ncbi:MAG: hypothetical protein ACE5HO_20770 [bacterium]
MVPPTLGAESERLFEGRLLIIERRIEKLTKRLKRYHPDACRLEMRFAKNSKMNLYQCSLELTVPQQVLAVKAEAADLLRSFREAYEALVERFEKYRLKINKSLGAKHHKKVMRVPIQDSGSEVWKQVLRQDAEELLSNKLTKDDMRITRERLQAVYKSLQEERFEFAIEYRKRLTSKQTYKAR